MMNSFALLREERNAILTDKKFFNCTSRNINQCVNRFKYVILSFLAV